MAEPIADMQRASDVDSELPPRWVRVVMTLSISGALLLGTIAMFVVLVMNGALLPLVKAHPAAMIGIPWSGGASFSVVLVCRASFGNTRFNVLGLGFEGASGPIVLWAMCFLAHIVGIYTLWNCLG
jgi:hypothetical protein